MSPRGGAARSSRAPRRPAVPEESQRRVRGERRLERSRDAWQAIIAQASMAPNPRQCWVRGRVKVRVGVRVGVGIRVRLRARVTVTA